ncbi:MAG: formylmethanofuran dehydrogenase subunit A [Acidiferrobacterales bacterium]|nr:formylmethanofuran dehydrogenase subunit A [Acidiferrobacterales bacterium]
MLTRIKGGTVYDPINGVDGVVQDLYIDDERIVDRPPGDTRIDETIDASGLFIMSGGIDIHTHIGGGKVNIARMMMTEDCDAHQVTNDGFLRSGSGGVVPSTFITGYEYAKLGYTMCFEPAIVPSNARQAHMEMADTPLLDTGGYLVLGNDEYFLRLLAKGADAAIIRDYIAFMVDSTQCIGVKVVNPGGISAFKFNQRALDVDEPHKHYGVTPGEIVRSLSEALHDINLQHPLHVHASNLGVPGNFASTISTVKAADGLPLHLAHVQFHSYGTEGKQGFSSAATSIAELVRQNPQISVDVGHVMFGQTVTVSADTMHQFANRDHAYPGKSAFMDIECEAGCGVVPFRYRSRSYANALQWTVGLELFLAIDNPWQVFLTTDHPNGASFTTYPHLIRLLMDKDYRDHALSNINQAAARMSCVAEIAREYSLYEIAIITRAGPARSLGLKDRGHLGPGANADIVLYRHNDNWENVFARPARVIKDGKTVVHDGEIRQVIAGRSHRAHPEYDQNIRRELERYFEHNGSMQLSNFVISDDEMANAIGSEVVQHTWN